jgi:hypothetical protein
MDIAARIRGSFAKQGLMRTLGAELGAISPGAVEIILLPSPAITQQHGFVHWGADGPSETPVILGHLFRHRQRDISLTFVTD